MSANGKLPARKLGHDLRDFVQQVVSTCHLLLVTEQGENRDAVERLLANSRESNKNFNALLEEVLPMKTPSLKVMVVEDDPNTRKFLVDTLERQGHKVVATAQNGHDMANIALSTHEIDMIVFDIHLPGQDGLEALEEIVRSGTVIPALAVTGDKDVALADRAAEEGVLNYLIKPVEPVQLVTALRVAWAKGQEFRALQQENDTLQATMERQKTMNRAKNVLMRRNRMSEDQAFRHLQKYSMDNRIPLMDVAKAVLEGRAI